MAGVVAYRLTLEELNVERSTLDELVAASANAKALVAEYDAHRVPVPSWLPDLKQKLQAEIAIRRRELLARELSEQRALATRLMPAEERRQAVADRIAALEAELASA